MATTTRQPETWLDTPKRASKLSVDVSKTGPATQSCFFDEQEEAGLCAKCSPEDDEVSIDLATGAQLAATAAAAGATTAENKREKERME